MQVWDLWFPEAAARGLPFARGRLDDTACLLVHAAPESLDVEVRSDEGALLAQGKSLARTLDSPMALLERQGATVTRRDIWPDAGLIGTPVILAGGEVGILLSWWHSEKKDEWRWRIELYNHA